MGGVRVTERKHSGHGNGDELAGLRTGTGVSLEGGLASKRTSRGLAPTPTL